MARRRIYFYKACFLEVDGRDLVELPSILPLFNYIGSLPADYSRSPHRYYRLQDNNDLYVQIDYLDADLIKGRFAVKRRSGLPRVEQGGRYRDLRFGKDEGLAEIRHFVLFVNQGVLGIEFNFFAPRISRLSDYLRSMSDGRVDRVDLQLLVNADVARTLQRLGRRSKIEIAVHRDRVDLLEELDRNLARAFRALKEESNALELAVEFKLVSRRRSDDLEVDWIDRLPDFLGGASREAISRLRLTAYDPSAGKTLPIDLLEDALSRVANVPLTGDDSDSVVSTLMYNEIARAYDQLDSRDLAASVTRNQ